MAEIICLGQNCEPKEMLEAYRASGAVIGRDPALRGRYLFDWTLLSERALVNALKTDFKGIFEPGQCCVHADGPGGLNTVMDQGSGIMFHHLFSRDTHDVVHQETIDAEFEGLRPKVAYLVDKMRKAMAHPDHVYFVRRWSPIERMSRDVVEALKITRQGRPFTLVSVVYDPSPYDPHGIDDHFIEFVIPVDRQFQIDAWAPLFDELMDGRHRRRAAFEPLTPRLTWFEMIYTRMFKRTA